MLRLLLALIAAPLGLALVAPLLALAAPMAVVGATTRLLARLREPRPTPWQALIEFDPAFGWRPRAQVDAYHAGEDDLAHVTTDAEGWRGRGSLDDSQIVVLGDSFAWGQGIGDEEFFAHLVPGVRVKAVGVMGYNMVQELLWLEALAPRLRGKLVVWLIYFGNDLFENLMPHMQGYRAPFLVSAAGAGGWRIATEHVRRVPWFTTGLRNGGPYYRALAEYCTDGEASRRAYAACEFLLRRGAAACADAGAQLAVVTIPDKTQLSPEGIAFLRSQAGDPEALDPRLPDQMLGEICARLEIPFVAGAARLRPEHYQQLDCHWNASGHREAAGILADLHTLLARPAGVPAAATPAERLP